jgi:hypothetical protein
MTKLLPTGPSGIGQSNSFPGLTVLQDEKHEHSHNCSCAHHHTHSEPQAEVKTEASCFFTKYLPLEKLYTNENGKTKQFISMLTNLSPAFIASEILTPFEVSPFIKSPVSIFSMYLSNRGINKIHKPILTSLGSLGILSLQQFAGMSRKLLRPLMALAVFVIERLFPDHDIKTHKECNEHDDCNHKHDHKNEHNQTIESTLFGLGSLELQINTIAPAIDFLSEKIFNEYIPFGESFLSKFSKSILSTTFKVLGLSGGFLGAGKLIQEAIKKLAKDKDNLGWLGQLAGRVEGFVCGCCGGIVCVSEVSTEGSVEATKFVFNG